MIPDKIYLTSTPYRILDGWCDSKTPITEGMEQVEYIRKGFLLEWASEMENCSQLSAPLLVHELVKKLNSL